MKAEIEIADRNDPDAVAAALAGLQAHDAAFTAHGECTLFQALIRDGSGQIAAALVAQAFYGWMYVQYLWVDDARRGQGDGTKLMQAAETRARELGCIGMRANTLSFQARGFYEKLGYAVFATLPDYPPGHAMHMFKKRI
ncbi:MAG: GNAT family N-acetyltransferase [Rhodospirillales bacterium]|nr:GNAT family N-acetyltransferase [Alphaproteobacteria bacterium]MCB9987524.1 GNAT family N-acetyltransferase [Rhodospirillales bacterium]USO07502.1 MAG: GNAT family N-acetyltransferase [Rhodospirillales bacterium]